MPVPEVCSHLRPDHSALIGLLKALMRIPGIKHIFSASGIRYDLVFSDKKNGDAYIRQIAGHHVSGQLKIAPEHTERHVLEAMGKAGGSDLMAFKKKFDAYSREAGKPQYLTYYFIAAHPGCTVADMENLKRFTRRELKINPEQVQIYTPTPSTYSALMYHTGLNPFTGKPVFVEKQAKRRERQKRILVEKNQPKRTKRSRRS